MGLVYKLKHHKIQKLHNFGRMTGFCLSSPLQNTQRTTLPLSARLACLGCTWSPFPSKILSTGKCRQLQHDYPSVFKEEEKERGRERSLYPLFIPWSLEAFSFSANPILDCSPVLWATSFHSPSLLIPRDLIRSLCTKGQI